MKKIASEIARPLVFALLMAAVALQGCALFVSHYDAGAYQYFTSLKAYHVKFLDDNKTGEEKLFDEAKANTACDTGELKFREASEYANGKQDTTRVKAIEYLHNAFSRQCELLTLKSKKLFGSEYVVQEMEQIKKNYDLAIAGESARVGAPSK